MQTAITDMPIYVIDKILSYLDWTDINSAMASSRLFHVMSQNQLLARKYETVGIDQVVANVDFVGINYFSSGHVPLTDIAALIQGMFIMIHPNSHKMLIMMILMNCYQDNPDEISVRATRYNKTSIIKFLHFINWPGLKNIERTVLQNLHTPMIKLFHSIFGFKPAFLQIYTDMFYGHHSDYLHHRYVFSYPLR